MLNGKLPRPQITIQSTPLGSEQATDSCEPFLFSLKDTNGESANSFNFPISPSCRQLRQMSCPRKNEESTCTSANLPSHKVTEEVKSSVGTSITEFRLATLNSPEALKCIDIVMGSSPCAGYCNHCKTYVHTVIDYRANMLTRLFLKISQNLPICCGPLDWATRLIIHKCPKCDLILGAM